MQNFEQELKAMTTQQIYAVIAWTEHELMDNPTNELSRKRRAANRELDARGRLAA